MENFIFFQATIVVLLIIDVIYLLINRITKVKNRATPNITSADDIVSLDETAPNRYLHP